MNNTAQMTKKFLILLAAVSSVAALGACTQPSATNPEQPATEQAAGTTGSTTPPETTSTSTTTTTTTTTPAVASENTGTTANLVSNESESIVQIAAANPSFSSFTKAVEAAGLTETLSAPGAYTVFAPTDEAFAALPAGTLEELMKPENKENLAKILQYHVLPTKVAAAEIQTGEVATVEGDPVNLEVAEGKVTVNGAEVVQPDINANNGVIHVIKVVIIPPDVAAPTTSPEAASPEGTSPEAASPEVASPEATSTTTTTTTTPQ
ncbi:fasciclin domain-containing protein [Planktothrix paucivesiculata]|uniref:Transforming growth factor induced protein n=1 Tax=Planktothrix paucivesiculata PCC 9631 TaxID=671071 RepID=A0A7Z9C0K9_9CYAN|nr:fasciclin domain-containing protein [Planktothrix paucivesiculata]VXD22906.1 Transforming growth factor induced protein [Planktothrix paucivesiculata PCC 9631]